MRERTSVIYAMYIAVIVLMIATLCIAGCTTPEQKSTPVATTAVPVTTTHAATVAPANATPAAPVNATPATPVATAPATTPTGPREKLILATTTSLYDTGLLDFLKPVYEKKYNVELLITSQGTGKAIEIAKRGDCDILAVHSPSQEVAFMEEGSGVNRRCFAYNYFIIIGPESDPAGIRGTSPEDALALIRTLGKDQTKGVAFVSRGDNSGTHSAEKTIWKNAKLNYTTEVQKTGAWYIEAGRGMGETLQMASEKGAYTLTDEGTFLAYKSKLNVVPLITEGASLLNVYSVMIPYNDKTKPEKIQSANTFVTFLLDPTTQTMIGEFGKEKYGKNLFTPMSANCSRFKCDCTSPATAVRPLLVYHAGTLASVFGKLKASIEKADPSTEIQLYSAASQVAIEKVTKEKKPGDVVASADYYLLPKYMIPGSASYYINFASNQMVIAYTNKSHYATEITPDNWYTILQRENVTVMISDPDSDPGGYRALMLLSLAEQKYGDIHIFNTIVGSHSTITRTIADGKTVIDVTKATADGKKFFIYKTMDEATQLMIDGKVDYRIAYKNVAVSSGLNYITLSPDVDLSSRGSESRYKTVSVKRNAGTEEGIAILYGITIPSQARQGPQAISFVKQLLSPEGQALLSAEGFTPLVPAVGYGNVPVELKSLVTVYP